MLDLTAIEVFHNFLKRKRIVSMVTGVTVLGSPLEFGTIEKGKLRTEMNDSEKVPTRLLQ